MCVCFLVHQAIADPASAPAPSAPSSMNAAASPAAAPSTAASSSPQSPSMSNWLVEGQTTVIVQHLFPFKSPYSGPNSLISRSETEATNTYTAYIGYRVKPGLEAYFDPEMALGNGLSTGLGLAGFTNGEIVRNPTLSHDPYIARAFLRWTVALAHGAVDVDKSENQFPETTPQHRIVVTGGKLAVTDIFDLNRYEDSTRTQFMNWALMNNPAWDYPADTRGYTQGGAVEWINPNFAVRYGFFEMPVVANGIELASYLPDNNGQMIEVELHPKAMATAAGPGIVRLMTYRNLAHMGNYQAAVNVAAETHMPPDITAVETPGNVKYGFGLNFEEPLRDGGNTGIFGRLGWDDGATESFAYTEADRHIDLGYQLSGAHWSRPNDVFAIDALQDDLAAAHAQYLADGGLGFLLGDGKLHYGPERIAETYYNYQLSKHDAWATIFLGPDFQEIADPGYNMDRGPVSVVSMRAHAEF